MIKYIILSSGDAALIVNETVVMTADPAFEDSGQLETIAENLSNALDRPLQRIESDVPYKKDWNWDDVLEEMQVDAGFVSSQISTL